MKNILVSLLVLFSTILSAAPQSKSGQVGFYQATGVAGTNRFLWDRTNDWLFLTHGALVFGTNNPLVAAEVIRAVSDSTAGDPSARTWTMEANNTGAGTYGGALVNVNDAGSSLFELYNHLGAGSGLVFDIKAADGVTPFALNATVAHTSGSLLSVSNFDVGKFDAAHNGMIWSATNRFAFNTTTNVWPLTNAVAGQVLTSVGGASAQLYWSTASASGPSFSDLVWTNTGTAIQPTGIGKNTNAISFGIDGSTLIGFDAASFASGGGLGIVQTNDPGGFPVEIFSVDPGWNRQGQIRLKTQSTSVGDDAFSEMTQDIFNLTGTTVFTFYTAQVIGATPKIQIGGAVNGNTVYLFEPTATASTTPYTFDTSLGHTSGNLNEWKNLGVTHLVLASTNGITTPAITAYGAGSHPWQFGMATNTVDVLLGATNAVEIVVNGVAYLLPAKLK